MGRDKLRVKDTGQTTADTGARQRISATKSHAAQPVRPQPAPEEILPDIAAQRESGARLGHRLEGIEVQPVAPELAPLQRMEQPKPDDDEVKTVRQAKRAAGVESALAASAAAPNETGLPDTLKSGIETLSGLALDDVSVHYNSARPAEVQALAYTQGADIHVAPGQERHLPHEAWHVVQQKQGRVQPTMQMKGVDINDDQGLEREADVMAERAAVDGQFAQHELHMDGWSREVQHLAQRTNQTQHSNVIQKAGPEYEEESAEKKHMRGLKGSWDAIEAGVGDDDREKLNNRLILMTSELPDVPEEKIIEVLKMFPNEGVEVILKQILMKCSLKELQTLHIRGRYSNWQLINERLGVGSEASVYWGFKFSGGPPVAIKIFKGHNELYEYAFRKEINAHQLLKKFEQDGDPIPNVVRMLDYNTYLKSVIMEHVRGYSVDKLKDELINENKRLPKESHLNIDKIMGEMQEKKAAAIVETRNALLRHGYKLGDLQDRNIMYDYVGKKITFIDISLDKI